MMTTKTKYVAIALISGVLGLPACQSVTMSADDPYGNSQNAINHSLPAQTFLGADLMESKLHKVDPKAFNDGYANTYRIQTPYHQFTVQGTKNAKARIHEIEATELLKKRSTVGAGVNAFTRSTANLARTPLRAGQGIAGRYQAADNFGDVLLVAPSGIGEIIGDLTRGVRELGVTGARISRSAAGTKCAGVGDCVASAGRDIFSGLNSIAGKHDAARRTHQALGTDPYTDNAYLQREVGRLAYADSYVGTTYKFTIGAAGIPAVSPLAQGVGYYNNAEFTAQYQDADRRKNTEKATLRGWGITGEAVEAFYKNETFTQTQRTHLVQALALVSNPGYRNKMFADVAQQTNKFAGQSKLEIARYFGRLDDKGHLSGFVSSTPVTMAVGKDGTLILPLVADYLHWTDEVATLVKALSVLPQRDSNYRRAAIHVLGKATPEFKAGAQRHGVSTFEITL